MRMKHGARLRAGYPIVVEDAFRRALEMRRIGDRLAMRYWAKMAVFILQESRQGVAYTFNRYLEEASGWSKLLGDERIAARLAKGEVSGV